jgi:plastocyanin
MKKIFLAGLFPLIMSSAYAGPSIVLMKSISFEPKTIEIQAGDSLVWENRSYTDHSATSDSKDFVFDTDMVSPGTLSKPLIFSKAGTYMYHCKMHGRTMSGRVVVKAASKTH